MLALVLCSCAGLTAAIASTNTAEAKYEIFMSALPMMSTRHHRSR
jgi:hypothetical protein